MKSKLIINNKEIEVEIPDYLVNELMNDTSNRTDTSNRVTGYERMSKGHPYYYVDGQNNVVQYPEAESIGDSGLYDSANYYSSQTVAENNARADKLMRQLRRFAVEHREKDLRWSDEKQTKYLICFDGNTRSITVYRPYFLNFFSAVYFDSEEVARLAIKTFYSELMWYFTEYKDCV